MSKSPLARRKKACDERAVKVHSLKIWPEFYEAIDDGRKCFELRKNDRLFEVGDHLHLMEWIPYRGTYTGRMITAKVKFVLMGVEGLKDGFCILSLEIIQKVSTS